MQDALSCKGLVLIPGDQAPIVLAAIDWLGVANAAQDEFKAAMAEAAATTTERCVIHSIHQHDAPRCDLSAATVLATVGREAEHFDVDFIRGCIGELRTAIVAAIPRADEITSVQTGKALVQGIASNRRMLGPNGKVHTTRYTACRDPRIRELPEGVVDPWLKCIVFNGKAGPLATLTCYATHPQSYYRTGKATPDFPGLARNQRQRETGVFHLHFNGAGGNIGAGKYNDGAVANRLVLTDRMANAMKGAQQAAMRSQ